MKLGLGTGSTARYFVDGLGQKCAEGLDVVCVPTSEATRAQAAELGIAMAELARWDVLIYGRRCRRNDARLAFGQGWRGALLREKIVAAASDAMIVIADDTKLKDHLGLALPVEVNKFAHDVTAGALQDVFAQYGLSGSVALRGGETPFETDGGHFIYDCALGKIDAPHELASALLAVPGVVEHGLFLTYATGAVLAGTDSLTELGDL